MPIPDPKTAKPLKDSEVETATRDRLIEGNLKPALSYLYDYVNKGVDLSEMIAQANLALTEAIDSFVKNGRNGKLASIVEKAVKDSIYELIEESGETRLANEQLAERLNTLSDVSVELVEEYGRQPTNAELAHRLNTTEEEIREYIRQRNAFEKEHPKYTLEAGDFIIFKLYEVIMPND